MHPHRLLLFTSALALAASASADTVTFANGASDLASFNDLTSAGLAGTSFSAGATAGASGGAGLSHTATDETLIYKTASFDFSPTDAAYTVSMMFKSANFSTGAYAVGFSADNNLGFYGGATNNNISFRANAGGMQIQSVNAGVAANTGLAGTSFVNGDWYRFELTLSKSATLNTFNYAAVLEDWGVNGAGFVGGTPYSASGTVTNAALYADSTAFAGARMTPAGSLDNFVVTAVPEPSAYGLIGAGTLIGVSLLRRRRKAPGIA